MQTAVCFRVVQTAVFFLSFKDGGREEMLYTTSCISSMPRLMASSFIGMR